MAVATPASKTKTIASKKAKKITPFCIGTITPLTMNSGGDLFCRAVEGLCELGFKTLALAEGDEVSQNACFGLLESYPESFQMLESVTQNKAEILDSADVLLFPIAPEESLKSELLSQGKVLILPEGNGISNFNPQQETGEGFTFLEGNFWSLMAAVIRASENRKFKYDWNLLRKNIEKLVA